MKKNALRPKLAEAGPGAGKTHDMVDNIVHAIQDLPPHRFLAAITYTRAAGAMIRERLASRVNTKPNVFVGTTHSFVHRFILRPCAELLSFFPEDQIYAAINPYDKVSSPSGAAAYTRNLINKGIVPYDSMITTSRDILKITRVRDLICGRLAHIFVDEFQDTDIRMFDVFEYFRKVGKTSLYFVGDPEQYVMSFSYQGQRPPTFDKIPFFRLKKYAILNPIIENKRSNGEIVTFANQFRDDVQQISVKPYRRESRVLFIPVTSLEEIVRRYQELSANVEIEEKQRRRLYLSEENATFDAVREKFQLMPISNDKGRTNSFLGDALELLATALDRSQRKILEEYKLSRLELRGLGVRLLFNIRQGKMNIDQLKDFVIKEFKHPISRSRVKIIEDGLKNLCIPLNSDVSSQGSEFYTSIRKAKGLQADAALVVAKGTGELKKWLQTNRLIRKDDKQDKCRLGYVAFTRPKEMLCIACLKEVDDELVQTMQNLGIMVVDNKDYEKVTIPLMEAGPETGFLNPSKSQALESHTLSFPRPAD